MIFHFFYQLKIYNNMNKNVQRNVDYLSRLTRRVKDDEIQTKLNNVINLD